ncbi:DNA methyltransferase [Clostridium sp.]
MFQENLYGQIDNTDSESNISSKNINNPAILKDIPFDKIYESARKEASRKKPVFFIHKYFARRITCNFRLILLGLLLPYEEDIWKHYYKSMKISDNDSITILDPFMGGGTTIFESLRLNTKVIGNDLQPLSKFVTTALVSDIPEKKIKKAVKDLEKTVGEKIKSYYKTTCPVCKKEADVMYNFHVKKIPTDTPCHEHEFFSSFVLSLKKDEFTVVCPKCKDVYKTKFDNGIAICPSCDYKLNSPKESYMNSGQFKCQTCDEKTNLMDLKDSGYYPFKTNIIAQEYYCPHCKSHDYKSVSEDDINLYNKAITDYEELKDGLPIPQQEIPIGYNTKQIINHGYKYFKDLFNKRQLLSLGLLLKAIDEYEDDDVKFWLLLAFSGSLEMNNMFCRYQNNASKISNLFFNHAYVPITMPVENSIWGTKLGTGTFIKTIDKILRGKKFNKEIYDIKAVPSNTPSKFDALKVESKDKVVTNPVSEYNLLSKENPLITCGDSRNLSHIPNNSVDLVVTDPPYGSNIMYSELIDFFHVWNFTSKYGKTIGFNIPLTTKKEEIIVNSVRNLTFKDYEEGLTKVFSEANRVTKDNGFLTFSFHDKSLDSWYSVINSLINSGYELVAAYPMHSETRTGAHTSNKNSIAFDIFLVCKKINQVNKAHSSVNEVISKALEKTEEFVERLNTVEAEMTIPDIENIFISQFFVKATELGIDVSINDGIVKSQLNKTIASIDELFSKYQTTQIRSGWWSELYKNKWDVN